MTTNREYGICQRTPAVSVLDNQGRTVREIQYHRHPDTPEITDERITRHHYGILGFLSESTDPRLYAQRQKDPSVGHNFTYLTSLSGAVLRIESADAGTSLTLSDVAGRAHLMVSATGVMATWQYENEELSGRPLCMIEQDATGTSRITERFLYAGNTQGEKDRNLCGLCVHHYETAGLVQTDSVSLTGRPLAVTRQLLKETAGTADWQGEDASAWNDLLTPERYTTLMTVDASGAVLTTTDAAGNLQRVAYDVAGVLNSSWLTVKDGQEQIIVKALAYSAAGQKLREEHHNGLVTTYRYAPETQQLTEIITERPAGHPAGARVLQHHSYEYDPVGNMVRCTDNAEETRFWRNQKVLAENTYVYDSLYQLISSTGREMAGITAQGVMLPSAIIPLPTDSNAFTPYTRTYRYDVGSNLTQIRHSAPASGNRYTTEITVSDRNNRAVLNTLAASPDQVDALFSAGGQQGQLAPGQHLTWTSRGELGGITPVQRDGQPADSETYRYDAGSQRIIKISTQKTANSSQAQRTLYLPGLEIRTTTNGNNETEILHTLIIGNARMLHWVAGKNTSDQIRYSYGNLTGNSGLEVDGEGKVISLEEYYPFGGTAVWTARSRAEADWKTIRYSGKERDATGLYYYGYRYYQPWAGRWLSADPAGTVDGINLYRMVRNNPVTFKDSDGRMIYRVTETKAANPMNLYEETSVTHGVAINFNFPRLKVTDRTQHYLDRSGHGNAFVGVIHLKSGNVEMHPLTPMEANRWGSAYSGSRYKGDPGAITHHGITMRGTLQNQLLSAHEQLVKQLQPKYRGAPGTEFVGFSFNDLRNISPRDRSYMTAAQTYTSPEAVKVNSMSLNAEHVRVHNTIKSQLPTWATTNHLAEFTNAVTTYSHSRERKPYRELSNLETWAAVGEKGDFINADNTSLANRQLPDVIASSLLHVLHSRVPEEGSMARYLETEMNRPAMKIPKSEERARRHMVSRYLE
ncbi:MAG: RHS repeat protein [Rouxiella aceris]|uniref:RHS repeat domain-containing protein n=1 Tax=Rouxiella aceris TaxID=2703884 RepID=UPI0028520A7A|nr:RHS repeat domain-containing protein [Rouxiella aceris]MDR3430362.1 RHS repeat protein [Rouxiella aceris]